MKKINNKGMTIVELLVCFVLVSIITTSLFATISVFSNKRTKESVKSTIFTYKNTVAKDIQDDLVNKNLVAVSVVEPNADSYTEGSMSLDGSYDYNFNLEKNTYRYAIFFKFRDGTKKVMTIRYQSSDGYINVSDDEKDEACDDDTLDDQFYITYGDNYPGEGEIDVNTIKSKVSTPKTSEGNFDLYTLPNVGDGPNSCGEHVLDLRFDDVTISTDNNVFKLYLGFYHPSVGKEYALDIVAPMNYFTE